MRRLCTHCRCVTQQILQVFNCCKATVSMRCCTSVHAACWHLLDTCSTGAPRLKCGQVLEVSCSRCICLLLTSDGVHHYCLCSTLFTTHCLSYCCEPMWLLSMSIASLFLLQTSQAQDDDTKSPNLRSSALKAANHGRMHLNHYIYTYMRQSRTGKLSRAKHLFSHHWDQQGPYNPHYSTADSS